jgi:hypothetical protein
MLDWIADLIFSVSFEAGGRADVGHRGCGRLYRVGQPFLRFARIYGQLVPLLRLAVWRSDRCSDVTVFSPILPVRAHAIFGSYAKSIWVSKGRALLCTIAPYAPFSV